MRAREFIREKNELEEAIPAVLGALGGALARGVGAAGQAIARGAVTGVQTLAKGATAGAQKFGQMAASGAQKIGSAAADIGRQAATQAAANMISGTSNKDKPTTPQPPIKLPPNIPISVVPSNDPEQLSLDIGGLPVKLDLAKPEVKQALQQLGQVKPL